MDRRRFLINMVGAAASSHVAARSAFAKGMSAASATLALPTAYQLAWQDMELGMFMHFGPNTWQDVESDNLTTPVSAINPKRLDTDQWAQCAVALSARYIVFVA